MNWLTLPDPRSRLHHAGGRNAAERMGAPGYQPRHRRLRLPRRLVVGAGCASGRRSGQRCGQVPAAAADTGRQVGFQNDRRTGGFILRDASSNGDPQSPNLKSRRKNRAVIAKQSSLRMSQGDCFIAEPVIGRAFARPAGSSQAMTNLAPPRCCVPRINGR